MKIFNQDEIRARFMPGVRLVFRFPRPRGVMSLLNFQRRSLHPDRSKRASWQGAPTVGSNRRSMSPNQVSRSQRNELSPQSVDRGLNDVGDTWDRQHSVKELVQG